MQIIQEGKRQSGGDCWAKESWNKQWKNREKELLEQIWPMKYLWKRVPNLLIVWKVTIDTVAWRETDLELVLIKLYMAKEQDKSR